MVAMLAAVLLLAPADAPKLTEAGQKELKKLEGKWQILKEVQANEEKDRSADPDGVIEFQGHKVHAEKKEAGAVTALDPTTDPKCLDLKINEGPAKGMVLEAIYKLDGDNLTIAVGMLEKKRPGNFDKPTEAGIILVTLKRIKD